MLKRIANTGLNLVVLGVSVAVFLAAFFALSALGAAQKPPTIEILSATRDLNIGDVIAPEDLAVKTVFQYANQNPLFSLAGNTTAYELTILNAGILFDLEVVLAWKSLTGEDLGSQSLWMFLIE